MKTVALTINGRVVSAAVEPRTHLADFLREHQNLTGTHIGCEHGVCGACTILIDGVPARSCITYAVACDGAAVTTIEGLEDDDVANDLRTAFSREHGLQCGYCTPGMLISARDFILRTENPDEREIRVAMSGNLCRCTGYVGIVRAIESVIDNQRKRGIARSSYSVRSGLGPAGGGRGKSTGSDGRPAAKVAAVQSAAFEEPPAAKQKEGLADFVPQATFEQSFVVKHPIEQVWEFFGRVNEVAACLPGAIVTSETGGRDVAGKMRVRVGPIAAEFSGVAEIERDPATYSGTIRGAGRDVRSSSATRGVIDYRLVRGDDAQTTRVNLSVGYTLTGALAQFSRSNLVRDIAGRLTEAFARNVEGRLSAPAGQAQPAAAQELNAGSLVFSVVAERIKALFRRVIGR